MSWQIHTDTYQRIDSRGSDCAEVGEQTMQLKSLHTTIRKVINTHTQAHVDEGIPQIGERSLA